MTTPTPKRANVRASLPPIEDIREALGIADNAKDDEITALMSSTIALIETYLGRGFIRADEVEEIDPPESRLDAVLLFRYPVESVTSVTRNDVALTGYRLQKAAGVLRFGEACGRRRRVCCEENWPLVVSYTGGYADDALPADLVDCVMRVFYGRWQSTGGTGNLADADSGGAIRSVAVDGLTVTRDSPSYAGAAFADAVIPPELASVAAALDPYRARRAGGV